VPGYRYHAFADAPIHDLMQPTRSGLLGRFWARLAIRLLWEMEREQLHWASRSFLGGAVVGAGCRITARAWCVNPGPKENIQIGNRVICRGLVRSESFHAGTIIVGDEVYLGDDSILSSAARIEIGRGSLLAHGVHVFDNDSHPIDPTVRERDHLIAVGAEVGVREEIAHAPIEIGPNVWVGHNSVILKGVRIGEGSVVAASSVVTSAVPAHVIVAGNPARIVREIRPNSLDE
jgi:acetyltransferase-like isoleucine patch superfamily enzyme